MVGAVRESGAGEEMVREVGADVAPAEGSGASCFLALSVVLEQPMASSKRPSNAATKRVDNRFRSEFEILFLTCSDITGLLFDKANQLKRESDFNPSTFELAAGQDALTKRFRC